MRALILKGIGLGLLLAALLVLGAYLAQSCERPPVVHAGPGAAA